MNQDVAVRDWKGIRVGVRDTDDSDLGLVSMGFEGRAAED